MARYSVTDWFRAQALRKVSEPKRVLTIGGSDYSERVVKWPRVKTVWNQVSATKVSIELANEDKALNFFLQDKTHMSAEVELKFGYTHPTSGDELVSFFKGATKRFTVEDGGIALDLEDKFAAFEQRTVGTDDSPVEYIGSNYLVSDIAWWLCVSYGGLDGTKNILNPDIAYSSFKSWAEVFSSDSVYINARFTGMKVVEALKIISRITQSAIYPEVNKLHFKRFSLIDSYSVNLDEDNFKKASLDIDGERVTNRQYVSFGYDVTSDYFQHTVVDASTPAINSYGLFENTEADKNVWYIDTPSALNYAQRIISTEAEPFEEATITATLQGLIRQVGDTVKFTNAQADISAAAYRIMEKDFNMDTGEIRFVANASQVAGTFRLDYSALDGSDVLA